MWPLREQHPPPRAPCRWDTEAVRLLPVLHDIRISCTSSGTAEGEWPIGSCSGERTSAESNRMLKMSPSERTWIQLEIDIIRNRLASMVHFLSGQEVRKWDCEEVVLCGADFRERSEGDFCGCGDTYTQYPNFTRPLFMYYTRVHWTTPYSCDASLLNLQRWAKWGHLKGLTS